MMKILVISACLALAGCSGPGGVAGTRAVAWSKASDDTYHCKGEGSGGQDYPSCRDIPVVVLIKDDGTCLAVIPYSRLRLHAWRKANPAANDTQVVWRLFAPDRYRFADADGVTITKKASSPPSYPEPGTVYEDGGLDGGPHANGKRFKFKVNASAQADLEFDHNVRVVDNGVNPPRNCTAVDPIIHNDAN